MPRSPCCSKVGLKKGPWSSEEDKLLQEYIGKYGEGQWKTLPQKAGLLRCGKSCRLRWMNYLRPGIKRGNICEAEEGLIILLHRLLKNRWSLIAGRLPGRTDNEIKNYWNTHIVKKLNSDNKSPPEKQKKSVPSGDGESSQMKKQRLTKEKNEVVEKIKVYTPKVIRLSPTFKSTDDFSTGGINPTTGRDAVEITAAIESNTCPMRWPSLSDLGSLPLDDGAFDWDHIPDTPEAPLDDEAFDWDHIPDTPEISQDPNKLAIVYDEFLQLI